MEEREFEEPKLKERRLEEDEVAGRDSLGLGDECWDVDWPDENDRSKGQEPDDGI